MSLRRGQSKAVRGEHGQVLVEFAGSIWLVLLAALAAWELALIGWTAVAGANAARTTARAYSRVGDQVQAVQDGKASLQGDGLAGAGASVTVTGETATVIVRVPIVLPWIQSPLPPIVQTADIPRTG